MPNCPKYIAQIKSCLYYYAFQYLMKYNFDHLWYSLLLKWKTQYFIDANSSVIQTFKHDDNRYTWINNWRIYMYMYMYMYMYIKIDTKISWAYKGWAQQTTTHKYSHISQVVGLNINCSSKISTIVNLSIVLNQNKMIRLRWFVGRKILLISMCGLLASGLCIRLGFLMFLLCIPFRSLRASLSKTVEYLNTKANTSMCC